ncbi:hypothetical protein LOTGIDRAFT_174874 [Lottia gigantea]|uniref:G-protein coupled receptors family 1 profile domain-containing protein n=1 Tax=Lottia gigantea TaxID=225164 RepID=V3ZXN4_LOTGI|nr:hypothetical protein LOTGIDRAFT_174874 [Lottia gigantea]ESO96308.1 hypothetical protein LOTGIDRAFT_174874 [Lottia gigantea]
MSLAESKDTYIVMILNWLLNNNSTNGVDFTQPYVRRSLRYVYPLFMFLHAVVGIVGIVGNLGMLVVIVKRRLYHDQTYFLMTNMALSDLIKCIFVLPITLANLLIQNWLFGSFMCFFLPMIQCFPVHASMLTFVMIAIDRYRLIVHPFKSRLPAGLCVIGVWVAAVCVVLPYAVYIKYIDLGASLGKQFDGVGICYVNVEKRIEEYIRAIFVTFNNGATTTTRLDPDAGAGEPSRLKSYNEAATQDSDDDLDLVKEKRTQNYLIAMTTLFAMCWCPLQILILVHYFVHENDDNMDHYDITYITFTWFGFLSTCTNSILFVSWRMSSATKDRLRGYFRFSNRRSRSQLVILCRLAKIVQVKPTSTNMML